MSGKRYTLGEVCELARVERSFVVRCLRAHWVSPAFPQESELDERDLARLRLIADLVEDFGVNEEAVPLILHLLDQVYLLREGPPEDWRKRERLLLNERSPRFRE